MPPGDRKVKTFRDLVVWQKALDLAEAVYVVSRRFPKEEIYGITSQMRQAAVSIASNIAEGHGQHSRREFFHFLGIARGSLAELQTHVILAARLGMLDDDNRLNLETRLAEVGRLLNGLRKAIRRPPDAPTRIP